MFALPGIILVLIFDYIKPSEIFPILQRLPMLHIFTALAVVGFVVDLRVGVSRLRATPQLPWVAAFYVWCLITAAIQAPHALPGAVLLLIPLSLYLVVGHSVQTFRAFQVVIGVIFAIGLFLAVLGVHQGLSPKGCHKMLFVRGDVTLKFDGRPCQIAYDCQREGGEPGFDYTCERVGLLGTSSVGGRVRYRGTLADPNELSLALGITLPFAFAAFDRRRGVLTALLLVATSGLIAACAVFSQSRGGQLVFLAVLATYFVRRAGVKGLVVGMMLALPVLLLGGRSGGDTQQSTTERLEAWSAGTDFFFSAPLFGLGATQFLQHHWLTAHSAYVLTGAELGFPGLVIFSVVVYLSLKIPFMALRSPEPIARVAETWSMALLAAFFGIVVGIAFLSFAYKEVLWIYIGLSAALYQCVKRHQPGFAVRVGRREVALIAIVDAGLMVFIRYYVRWKGL